MPATLGEDLDRLVRAQVDNGQYATEEDVLRDMVAWFLERRQRSHSEQPAMEPVPGRRVPASLGIFEDVADEIGEMTEEIMRDRERRWSSRRDDE